MQRNDYKNGYYRRVKLAPDGYWNDEIISVSQSADYINGGLEKPSIKWSAIGSVDVAFAEGFLECVKTAVKIAREWDKDTGKASSEVLL